MSLTGTADNWLIVVASVAIIGILMLVGGPVDILPFIGAYFLLFDLGPLISHLLGQRVYGGIVLSQLDRASFGLLLAMLGMLAAGLLVRQRSMFSWDRLTGRDLHAQPVAPLRAQSAAPPGEQRQRTYHLLPFLLFGLALYAFGTVALNHSGLFAGPKMSRIAAAGPLHYDFMLVEYCASALYFLAVREPLAKIAYWLNMAGYVLYCLATAERDFLFIVFTLLLHIRLVGRSPGAGGLGRIAAAASSGLLRWRGTIGMIVAGTAIVYTASYLAAARGGMAESDGGGALRQGSVLFVDTYVMQLVPAVIPFRHGGTYVDALIGIVADRPLLGEWLANSFVPDNPSSYGFSLVAEAYLNFGMVGIPIVFALLTLLHRVLINRFDHGPFSAFASMLFTSVFLYNFRGESITLIKVCVDGLLLYGLLHVTSTVSTARVRSGPRPADASLPGLARLVRRVPSPRAARAAAVGAAPGTAGAGHAGAGSEHGGTAPAPRHRWVPHGRRTDSTARR